MSINEAMEHLCFFLFNDEWEFYMYNATEKEEDEENEILVKAFETVESIGIGINEIHKHYVRQGNKMPEPKRFIDKPHFIPVDTEDLPF